MPSKERPINVYQFRRRVNINTVISIKSTYIFQVVTNLN